MDVARMLLYLLGGALVIAGIVLLIAETGLTAWIPAGVLLAGFIILVGLLLVGLSDRATHAHEEPPRTEHTERVVHEGGPRRYDRDRDEEYVRH